VELIRDVEYGRGGGRGLTLHVVRAMEAPVAPLPAVVRIHAGAWDLGTKDWPMDSLIALVRRGFVGVTIEHRFSGEAIFPAQIEDCKCAIRFLRAHATELRLDPDRIAVWGRASGGHLAALLGTTASVKELEGEGGWSDFSSAVQAVIDVWGPADLADEAAWKGAGYRWAVEQLLGGRIDEKRELARLASPVHHAAPGAPPFLILHGDREANVPLGQSEALAAALEAAGVTVSFNVLGGNSSTILDRSNWDVAIEFLHTHLRKNP
jgi:acetyl esterase/lipase